MAFCNAAIVASESNVRLILILVLGVVFMCVVHSESQVSPKEVALSA